MSAAWYTIAAHAQHHDGAPSQDAQDAFQPVGICVLTTEVGGRGHVQVTTTVTHSCLVDFDTPAGPQRVGVLRPSGGLEALRLSMPTDMCAAAAELTQLRMVVHSDRILSLPLWTADFPQLTMLRLSGGEAITQLPPTLTRLVRLKTVQLENMPLLAALPAWVSCWTALTALEIDECGLAALPDALAALPGLLELTLKGLPFLAEVPVLTGLLGLTVHHCAITALPAGLGAMTQLARLMLSACTRLEELPASVGALAGLRSLCVFACPRMLSLPPQCRALCARLEVLQISNVHPAPSWLGECSQLRELRLSVGNAALPPGLADLRALRILHLKACSGVAALPADLFARLNALEHLELADLPRLAALPDMGALSQLQTLILSNNPSFAALPESMGALQALHTCLLRRLLGLSALPAAFARLRRLAHLTVSDCGLDARAVAQLAAALRFFPLQNLAIVRLNNMRRAESVMLIGRALRRHPPPNFPPVRYQLLLHWAWVELGLPGEARLWGDEMIVRHWRAQYALRRALQAAMLAFAGGTHARLGALSRVVLLDDGVLEIVGALVVPRDPDADDAAA